MHSTAYQEILLHSACQPDQVGRRTDARHLDGRGEDALHYRRDWRYCIGQGARCLLLRLLFSNSCIKVGLSVCVADQCLQEDYGGPGAEQPVFHGAQGEG